MRVIADLHVHSRFSRAVSKDMDIPHLEDWGIKKGIELIGTGDFTHPTWLEELKRDLEPAELGIYKRMGSDVGVRFMLSTEISCIYSKNGATRRIHLVLLAPSFEVVEKINAQLGWIGKLKSNGRPILGLDAKELARIVLETSPDCLVIPAHIWTPWFSLFGSKSGFDSLEACFEEFSDRIPAIETGLSSDPHMNWCLSQLDDKAIVSFSDAHSPANIGREATVFELESLSFDTVARAVHIPCPSGKEADRIAFTIEFHPQEGMYYWDGHRNCDLRWSPKETKERNGVCPKCGKPVTVGVDYRVHELADRDEGYQPENRPGFKNIVPLPEIIADARGVGKKTKTVDTEYEQLLKNGGNEFRILLDLPMDEIRGFADPLVAEGIERVRNDKLHITPGYDGTYGIIKIFDNKEKEKQGQSSLFG